MVPGHELLSEDLPSLTCGANLTRGLGRSYGDASLPSTPTARVAGSRLADRVIAFDPDSGALHAEAGLTLRDINRTFLPRGWFVPVTPGTSFVTLGGAVASDVHGKNHHRAGTFGRHVRRLRLRAGTGDVVEASPEVEPDLFDATIGGMGLTGHMLDVEVTLRRVPSSWIAGETEYVPDLEALIERLLDAGTTWPYTLAWMDALGAGGRGRGVVYRGRWAEAADAGARTLIWPREIAVPISAPYWALSPFGMRWFNELVSLRYGRGIRHSLMHPQTFFYPLDSLLDWNKAYGRRGFTQYQCVLPHKAGLATYRKVFQTIEARGGAPYVVVIKDFGAEGRGRLSFPCPGMTFSIDMPVQDGKTQGIVDAVNDIVAAEGGRVYLTKDAFTREAHYRAMDARVDAFNAIRRRWDPEGRIRSALSVRLLGDAA
ncbi:MAG: FAD-binding oxidoreductase [Vicinamibacteraceae bacterium]